MKLPFIPTAISFSKIEEGGSEEPIEFGVPDPLIENPLQKEAFLFLLKALPKDRYRVIALLLYLRNEMDLDYTYEEIGQIWGCSKVNIFNHIRRMQSVLEKSGLFKASH